MATETAIAVVARAVPRAVPAAKMVIPPEAGCHVEERVGGRIVVVIMVAVHMTVAVSVPMCRRRMGHGRMVIVTA